MADAVLFLCGNNSCRSQMAEGLLRRLAGDRFDVYSAGLHPDAIHPLTRRVMEELGIDLSGHRARGVKEFFRLRSPNKMKSRHSFRESWLSSP